MSYTSKDGSKWTNLSQAKVADRRHDTKSINVPTPKVPNAPDPSEQVSEDPSEVVSAHGPAREVTIHHSDESHSVHSKHSDGHEHHSEHTSKEEAHETAKTLAGVGDEQTPEESPDQSIGNPMDAMMSNG